MVSGVRQRLAQRLQLLRALNGRSTGHDTILRCRIYAAEGVPQEICPAPPKNLRTRLPLIFRPSTTKRDVPECW